ncbi:MAG: hypothetical protein QXH07_01790 [Thermoplasmata archaeon]
MGWSGGGSANPDNETIKTNVQGELYVVPNPAAAGETSANGVGVLFDNATITLNANNQLQVNTGNANTWTAVQDFGTSYLKLGGAAISLTTLAPNQALMYNGTNWVNQPVVVSVTDQANAKEVELTSTTATTIATFTPSAAGNFMIMVYARVVTAATTLTLTASWTDATGAQSYSWISSQSEPVGSYVFLPLFINSAASAAITVTATAGTANQVYVSANIISLT